MFPKKGNVFPNADGEVRSEVNYRQTIAAALRRELGDTHRAVKTTMRWTGASERTAKNWIAGSHGPSGEHLISLMRHSDHVTRRSNSLPSARSRRSTALSFLPPGVCLRVPGATPLRPFDGNLLRDGPRRPHSEKHCPF